MTDDEKLKLAIALAKAKGAGGQSAPEARPEKTAGQGVREFFLGDSDPTTQNLGEKIGTFLNKAGESMTFGLVGDEASAAAESILPGVNYDQRRDHYRQQERLLEQSNPGAALTADIGGALLGALGPAGAIGTARAGAGMVTRLAASIPAGAGMAGTYGFMEGEGLDDRLSEGKTGAMIGAGAGLVAPFIGAGVQKIADSAATKKAISAAVRGAKTSDDLLREGNAAYQAIDDAGVQIKPQAFDGARQRILDALRTKTGFDELPGPGSLTPNSARVAQIMQKSSEEMATDPTAALPFRALDQMRRQAGAAAGNVTNKTDQRAGMTVIEGLDDFVKNLGADDVVAGDVQALNTAIPKARDIWQRMSKSQLVDDAVAKSDSYLSGGASGIRNRFASMLRNDKLMRGFTEAEKKVLQRVAKGTLPEQILYLVSGGLGNLGTIGLGLAGGGPVGAAAGAGLSLGLRKGAESLANRNAEIARAVVASGKLNTLPVATDSSRRLIEALMRRGAAAVPQ